VGPRARWDAVEKAHTSCPCQESNHMSKDQRKSSYNVLDTAQFINDKQCSVTVCIHMIRPKTLRVNVTVLRALHIIFRSSLESKCSLVHSYQCFTGVCYFCLQGCPKGSSQPASANSSETFVPTNLQCHFPDDENSPST
jgi:hypothetical protein